MREGEEIVFARNHRRRPASLPAPLADIKQVTSLKVLAVTVINHLSLSEHVRDNIGRCAQTTHALTILRSHGMSVENLRMVYKAVIISMLAYASNAWWGYNTSRWQALMIASFLLRSIQTDFYMHI